VGLEALGVDPGEESKGHGERRSTSVRAGPVQPFGWDFQTLCFGLVGPNFGRHPVGRSAYARSKSSLVQGLTCQNRSANPRSRDLR
jgi:hypothetical protein